VSGRRCKALRREFLAEYERPVRGTQYPAFVRSEESWASRLKQKKWWRLVFPLPVLRATRSQIEEESEWRMMKRLYKERRREGLPWPVPA
jgi:hypothetical protein